MKLLEFLKQHKKQWFVDNLGFKKLIHGKRKICENVTEELIKASNCWNSFTFCNKYSVRKNYNLDKIIMKLFKSFLSESNDLQTVPV